MNIKYDHLTNGAYGFPNRGDRRRIKTPILAIVHITGNCNNVGPDAAMGERDYANRTITSANLSSFASAHDYIDRSGAVVEAIDPALYAAWSNGGTNRPNTDLALVRTVTSLMAKGYNANEAFYREMECVGCHTDFEITDAQRDSVAQLIAADSAKIGIPISRATVGTHADLDSVNRPSCAFLPKDRESALADIIERAQKYAGVGSTAGVEVEDVAGYFLSASGLDLTSNYAIKVPKGTPLFYDGAATSRMTEMSNDGVLPYFGLVPGQPTYAVAFHSGSPFDDGITRQVIGFVRRDAVDAPYRVPAPAAVQHTLNVTLDGKSIAQATI